MRIQDLYSYINGLVDGYNSTWSLMDVCVAPVSGLMHIKEHAELVHIIILLVAFNGSVYFSPLAFGQP